MKVHISLQVPMNLCIFLKSHKIDSTEETSDKDKVDKHSVRIGG